MWPSLQHLQPSPNTAGTQTLSTSPHIQKYQKSSKTWGNPAGTQDATRFGRVPRVRASTQYLKMGYIGGPQPTDPITIDPNEPYPGRIQLWPAAWSIKFDQCLSAQVVTTSFLIPKRWLTFFKAPHLKKIGHRNLRGPQGHVSPQEITGLIKGLWKPLV